MQIPETSKARLHAIEAPGRITSRRGAAPPGAHAQSRLDAKSLYAQMARLRGFERALAARPETDTPPCIGDEAFVTGIAAALGPNDALVPTFREHAFAIGIGQPMGAVFDGLLRSRLRGSREPLDPGARLHGTSKPASERLSLTANIAISDRLTGSVRPVVCVLSDHAVDAAAFLDLLGKAIEWELPVVFVFENNQCIDSPLRKSLYDQARTFDVPSDEVDGMCVSATRTAMRRVLAKTGASGPQLVEALTFYHRADARLSPTKALEKLAMSMRPGSDPLLRFYSRSVGNGEATAAELTGILMDCDAEVRRALFPNLR